ncbi:hypothetical protein CC78DRAFT_581004 [Lojkania enalia]|uniref:Uncharacterized protein n=1 Tax=Lojkania enalia TaxID=147567 RepID=A0A9P4K787_9PLEO|nr:hypothetical protein CC78DRAFT_581004 [Didymosphaeria enalia]
MAQPTYASGAYTGAVAPNGDFQRFVLTVQESHLKHGYWRFHSEGTAGDDGRAYRSGFRCPEAVLVAEVRGDGSPDDIEIRWMPGEADSFRLQRRGTAKQHLEDIAAERKLLGLAWFGYEIPTYPVDLDSVLLKHRKEKLRAQLSTVHSLTATAQQSSRIISGATFYAEPGIATSVARPQATLGNASPSQVQIIHARPSGSDALDSTASPLSPTIWSVPPSISRYQHGQNGNKKRRYSSTADLDVQNLYACPRGESKRAKNLPKPLHQPSTLPPLQSPSSRRKGVPNRAINPRYSSPSTWRGLILPNRPNVGIKDSTAENKGKPSRSKEPETGNRLVEYESSDEEEGLSSIPGQGIDPSMELAPPLTRGSVIPEESSLFPRTPFETTLDSPTYQAISPTDETAEPIPRDVNLYAILSPDKLLINSRELIGMPFSCMDCGQAEGHHFGCHMASLQFKPVRELNVLEQRSIADLVEHFDPEQWREHYNDPPTPEPEDYETKLKEMAETLRGLDSFKNDPFLSSIDLADDEALILWAFKTAPNMKCEIIWFAEDNDEANSKEVVLMELILGKSEALK